MTNLRPQQADNLYKDEVLDRLASRTNVAQFVSFAPNLQQRYARLHGRKPNHQFGSIESAIDAILGNSLEASVNVRSFDPNNPKSREFVYGLKERSRVESEVRRLAASGLHTIINETIDIQDGGVSGVLLGNTLEFAPGDTPRAVEKPGTASLPADIGLKMLETVFGFRPALEFPARMRVEFSIHPLRRGFMQQHTIIWELEEIGEVSVEPALHWPNLFSRHIGDKAYGLLLASLYGLPVPLTKVVSRKVPPFQFGLPTGTGETWIRTCPYVPIPGKFTTKRGWIDPFQLLLNEDPDGTKLSSVLAQEGIAAVYSGALITGRGPSGSLNLTIEGRRGFGDVFMTGLKRGSKLPPTIESSVRALYERAASIFGPVRMEWVADRDQVWIVQLHRGETESVGSVIVPGKPSRFVRFEVQDGLEALRFLATQLRTDGAGIIVVGDVGITSHFGDVLRKAGVPSRIERPCVKMDQRT